MDESSIDEEREALNRRREEVTRQLQSLTVQDGNLDGGTAEKRRDGKEKETSQAVGDPR